MSRKQRSDPKLRALYKHVIEHEIFEDIRNYKITIVFSSVQLADRAWADCSCEGPEYYKIRVNASLKLMDVPYNVLEYLVGHELIHILPGCWQHNEKFNALELSLTGENFYTASVWLKRHVFLLEREYQYRKKAWLVRQVKEQLRIKDMAAICGCSITTIKRWLRKYDLEITYS